MTDISDVAAPSRDTVYSKIVGNDTFGELVSRIHSAVIRNGNELERFLNGSKLLVKAEEIPDLLSTKKHHGTYIIGKSGMKALKGYVHSKYEPDFVILKFDDGKAQIVEVKLGDKFDTKKSQGEHDHLRRFAYHFRKAYPELKTSIHICMFYQESKQNMVDGTHGLFNLKSTMTGRELCAILNVDYDEQLKLRALDWEKNKLFIAKQLARDPELNNLLTGVMAENKSEGSIKDEKDNNGATVGNFL